MFLRKPLKMGKNAPRFGPESLGLTKFTAGEMYKACNLHKPASSNEKTGFATGAQRNPEVRRAPLRVLQLPPLQPRFGRGLFVNGPNLPGDFINMP